MSRAAHQLLDNPRVLDDPLALRIVGAQGLEEIHGERRRFDESFARHLRAFVVARSRVAEDALADAVARGVHQYVVLGAGLDTFAYRNPYPTSMLRVFEVDHPVTQSWKRRQLASADIAIPESLTFVPIDFETQALEERLRDCRLRSGEPSFFSWLGVTMYLSRNAVMSTLHYIARRPPRSGVVFDYVIPPANIGLARRVVAQALLRRVAAAGEPWKTFFDPQALGVQLGALGFGQVEDIGPDELNTRLFSPRGDRLRVTGLGRLMSARV